ncbi:Coenzyme F420 hydrogenase/dehydrogenase, beta subunit C-terminal domain [Ruthenibacterium lactatiformans]|uniref:Coenzyme F420 hydrogenase/dehydrogenase, beta subunit C-terminal domain n=1 Tax=Ruthenibacterium lactatiformans TaxID=1550024 RepID=UPI002494517E|nr:Coenzyme F420 hydrogenase/dehydrogenase, beta subunit C-terminal domain [Ruthenibacterium lactatiformans]
MGTFKRWDIACHGVPSPKVWKEYLHWQEKKNKSKIVKVDFRNKKDFGWRAHKETLIFQDEKNIDSAVFTTLFYGHSILRPCCYECQYKSIMHPGDLTIADYWGIEKAAPEFDDNKGVSLVLVNNEVGDTMFNSVKDGIRWKETRLEDSMQASFKAPYPKPDNREAFWNSFLTKSFDNVAKEYAGVGFMNKVKRRIRKIKRKLIG